MEALSQPDIEAVTGSEFLPLTLKYEPITQFSNQRLVLRSTMTISSQEFGTLEQEQYRYVARRTAQSEQLFKRQLHKVLEALPRLLKERPYIQAVTIPVYNRMLKKANLASTIFEELATHPEASAANLCVEVSADVLFEDLEPMAAELQRVRDMGISIALWELGDPFCPLLRLGEIPHDFLFLDSYAVSLLADEEEEKQKLFKGLCQLLHADEKSSVIAVELPDSGLCERAERLGCDGYSLAEGVQPPKEEEADK